VKFKIDNAQRNLLPFDLLISAIERGDLPPGTRLRETELAEFLHVSRTPVREALHRLQVLGLAVHGKQRGLMVAQLSYEQLLQLFAVREGLEGLAARLATQNATREEVALLQDMVKSDKSESDPKVLSERNRALHSQIAYATHNSYMIDALNNFRVHLSLLPGSTYSFEERRREAQREHERIVDMIAKRDADGAEKIARTHIANGFRVRLSMQSSTANGR